MEIDVVTDVAFGRLQEFRSDLTAALLARRERVGSVATLEPGDAFWHLLLHDVLGAGEVPAGHREALRSLVPDAGGDSPLAVVVSGLRSSLVPRFIANVGTGDWEGVCALGLELRRAWRRRHRVDVAIRSTLRSAARHLPVAGSGLEGVSIAILGPDGAGKTTLAEGVRASIPIPARYVYLGIWRQSRFEERLRSVVGARLAVRLAKLLWKSILIRYHRRLGQVVLLDRYTLDADLPAANVDWKSRISTRLVRRTCPDPDLIILLDAPVELMYARKGEHGVPELQLRRDGYLAMTDLFPQMVVLDAAEPVGDVRRRATALLWERWSRNGAGEASG
jgi:thymidylate kinase